MHGQRFVCRSCRQGECIDDPAACDDPARCHCPCGDTASDEDDAGLPFGVTRLPARKPI